MLAKRFKRCDLFGTTVNFTYLGEDYYTTKCGTFVSIIAVAGYMALVGCKLIEFFGMTDAIHYMAVTKQDMQEPLDLRALGFSFAVEAIKPEYGQIVAHQVDWNTAQG